MLLMISLNQTLHPDFWMFEAHSNDLLKDRVISLAMLRSVYRNARFMSVSNLRVVKQSCYKILKSPGVLFSNNCLR